MDTPTSKNGSYLVFAVAIVALIALILGIYSVSKVSKLTKQLGTVAVADLAVRLDTVEASAKKASSDAERAATRVTGLSTDTQRAFDQVGTELASIRTSINKLTADLQALQEKVETLPTRVRSAAAPASTPSSSSGTVSSGSGESGSAASSGELSQDSTYRVQSGDTLSRIGARFGVPWQEILKANPGLDPKRLRVGQEIYIPAR